MSTSQDLFADHKADLDDEWHDTFDALTAQGKSPSGIKATIEYVTTEKTQKEASREFGVAEVTIRNLQAAVVALGPIDAKRGSTHDKGHRSALELCTHIADVLGWEEGIEYSVRDGSYGSSSHPYVLKEGWRSLHRQITGDGGADAG